MSNNKNLDELLSLKTNLINNFQIQKNKINERLKIELENSKEYKLLQMECLYNNIKIESDFNNNDYFEIKLSIKDDKAISINSKGIITEINLDNEIEDEVLRVLAISFKNNIGF